MSGNYPPTGPQPNDGFGNPSGPGFGQGDPYAQQPLQGDPYAQQPLQGDPYAQQPPQGDPYAQQQGYGQQPYQAAYGQDPYAQQGYGGGYPPQQPPKKGKGLMIGLIAGAVVLLLVIGVGVFFLLNQNNETANSSSSTTRSQSQEPTTETTSTTETTEPTSTETTTTSQPPQGSPTMPDEIGGFGKGSEYGSGEWIGAPEGSTSIAFWYKKGQQQFIAGNIRNARISDLNRYSFTNGHPVEDATCGTWLDRYVACFMEKDGGFVVAQATSSFWGSQPTEQEVLALVKDLHGKV